MPISNNNEYILVPNKQKCHASIKNDGEIIHLFYFILLFIYFLAALVFVAVHGLLTEVACCRARAVGA